jgi:hypothetical protein
MTPSDVLRGRKLWVPPCLFQRAGRGELTVEASRLPLHDRNRLALLRGSYEPAPHSFAHLWLIQPQRAFAAGSAAANIAPHEAPASGSAPKQLLNCCRAPMHAWEAHPWSSARHFCAVHEAHTPTPAGERASPVTLASEASTTTFPSPAPVSPPAPPPDTSSPAPESLPELVATGLSEEHPPISDESTASATRYTERPHSKAHAAGPCAKARGSIRLVARERGSCASSARTTLQALVAAIALGSVACGGSVASTPGAGAPDAALQDAGNDAHGGSLTDAGSVEASSDAGGLVACAKACIASSGGGGGGCPVLLLYECLRGPCGDNASTAICAAADGTPPSASTILCAQRAFPNCPANSCQNDATCLAFVACIEACH